MTNDSTALHLSVCSRSTLVCDAVGLNAGRGVAQLQLHRRRAAHERGVAGRELHLLSVNWDPCLPG